LQNIPSLIISFLSIFFLSVSEFLKQTALFLPHRFILAGSVPTLKPKTASPSSPVNQLHHRSVVFLMWSRGDRELLCSFSTTLPPLFPSTRSPPRRLPANPSCLPSSLAPPPAPLLFFFLNEELLENHREPPSLRSMTRRRCRAPRAKQTRPESLPLYQERPRQRNRPGTPKIDDMALFFPSGRRQNPAGPDPFRLPRACGRPPGEPAVLFPFFPDEFSLYFCHPSEQPSLPWQRARAHATCAALHAPRSSDLDAYSFYLADRPWLYSSPVPSPLPRCPRPRSSLESQTDRVSMSVWTKLHNTVSLQIHQVQKFSCSPLKFWLPILFKADQ
jgi:hypothetical protein